MSHVYTPEDHVGLRLMLMLMFRSTNQWHANLAGKISWTLIRPLQWDYLFLITQSLVQAHGWAFIIIIHYCGSSGSSAPSNSPSLGRSNLRKNLSMVIASKWHSKVSHGSNTFPTPSQTTVALSYTILYHGGPLAADDGSRKKHHHPQTPTR